VACVQWRSQELPVCVCGGGAQTSPRPATLPSRSPRRRPEDPRPTTRRVATRILGKPLLFFFANSGRKKSALQQC